MTRAEIAKLLALDQRWKRHVPWEADAAERLRLRENDPSIRIAIENAELHAALRWLLADREKPAEGKFDAAYIRHLAEIRALAGEQPLDAKEDAPRLGAASVIPAWWFPRLRGNK